MQEKHARQEGDGQVDMKRWDRKKLKVEQWDMDKLAEVSKEEAEVLSMGFFPAQVVCCLRWQTAEFYTSAASRCIGNPCAMQLPAGYHSTCSPSLVMFCFLNSDGRSCTVDLKVPVKKLLWVSVYCQDDGGFYPVPIAVCFLSAREPPAPALNYSQICTEQCLFLFRGEERLSRTC